MKRIILVAVVLVACAKKKKEEAPPPAPASGSPAAAVVIDAAAPPAKTELLPAKIEDKHGIVFSEKQGEQVTATVKGQSVMIPDGTNVEIAGEKEGMVGSGEDASITVKYEGKDVELSTDRVLVEGALARSPDGKHAVFTVVTTCGDLCHSSIYLVSADGKRTKLGEGGPDSHVAWSADKVAVGNHGLWVATLSDHKVENPEGYTSPSFAPDGTLYVRDFDGSAFKREGDKFVLAKKAKKSKKVSPDEEVVDDEDPEPVTFEGGKPKY
jgi:hypothetical protein